jgi:hypothetical protein
VGLLRLAHHQSFDGVLLGDRRQHVDHRTAEVVADPLRQRLPEVLGDSEVVVRGVAALGAVDAENQHRARLG